MLPTPEFEIADPAADHTSKQPGSRSAKGRFKHLGFDYHLSIAYGDDRQKMDVYARSPEKDDC